MVFRLTAIAVGVLLPPLVLEVVLRFTPTISSLERRAVDRDNSTARDQPDREFTWPTGWFFYLVNRGRINGAGFVNAQEYVAETPEPLLAIVGDSYVEALMVPYEATIQGRLARELSARGRVYSFAMSGAPLSQ